MKYLKILQAVFLSLILISTLSFAQDNTMKDKKIGDEKMSDEMMHDDMKIDKDENDVAIKGYDPVAYFIVGKPVRVNLNSLTNGIMPNGTL